MEKTYEVLMDTNIIENNTKESLRVNVKTIVTIDTFTTDDGEVITGANLKKESVEPKTLKEVTSRINELTAVINNAESERNTLMEEKTAMNTALDNAIAEKLANGGVDNREIIN